MSGLDIRLELDDRLSDRLRRAVAAATDLTRPMTEIAGELLRSTRRRFEGETGPDGKSWVPRKDKANPKPLLFASGDLQKQLTSEVDATSATVGVQRTGGPALYAAIHQFGGTIRPKTGKALKTPFGFFGAVTIPARPYLGFDERDRTRATTILSDHLRAAFEGEGE